MIYSKYILIFILILISNILASGCLSRTDKDDDQEIINNIFNVDDFGAKPDSTEDSGPAIREAIQAAIEAGPGSLVRFSPGKYYSDTWSPIPQEEARKGDYAYYFYIYDANRLIIDGNSAELILRSPIGGPFQIYDSRDVTIKNLSIDYETLPHIQGKVVSTDSKSGAFVIDIDEGFADFSEPWVQLKHHWGTLRDNDIPGMMKKIAFDHYFISSIDHVEGRKYKLTLGEKTRISNFDIGDTFVYNAIFAGGDGFSIVRSTNTKVEKVTLHSAPRAAFRIEQSDHTHIKGVKVQIKPGTNRKQTTGSDGVHVKHVRFGPIVEDSLFEGMADDGMNIGLLPNAVNEVISDTELVVSGGKAVTFEQPLKVGDTIQIFNPVNGTLRGSAKITDLHGAYTSRYTVVLDTPIKGIKAGKNYSDSDLVYNASLNAKGAIIRNNTFQNHRRHAMVIRCTDALIENNTYKNIPGHAIEISNTPDWPEGPFAENITIRKNTIENVGDRCYYNNYGNSFLIGAIKITSQMKGFKNSSYRGHQNITIENNTIKNWAMAAIHVSGAKDVKIINNALNADKNAYLYPGKTIGIVLENSDNIVIDKLNMTDPRAIKAGICITDTIGKDEVLLKNLKFKITKDIIQVDDLRREK